MAVGGADRAASMPAACSSSQWRCLLEREAEELEGEKKKREGKEEKGDGRGSILHLTLPTWRTQFLHDDPFQDLAGQAKSSSGHGRKKINLLRVCIYMYITKHMY